MTDMRGIEHRGRMIAHRATLAAARGLGFDPVLSGTHDNPANPLGRSGRVIRARASPSTFRSSFYDHAAARIASATFSLYPLPIATANKIAPSAAMSRSISFINVDG